MNLNRSVQCQHYHLLQLPDVRDTGSRSWCLTHAGHGWVVVCGMECHCQRSTTLVSQGWKGLFSLRDHLSLGRC